MRLLHTADWQLGLKLTFVPGDKGAWTRRARFDTVRRIAEVARTRGCDAVVVAGDVLDDNSVGRDIIAATRDALNAFAPMPVLLLPGNHDAATSACALMQFSELPHVEVLLDAPIRVHDATFYPAPLRQRHHRSDPTEHLEDVRHEPGIRVAVAHGAVRDFSSDGSAPNAIDLGRLVAKGYDYVALGDWHGALSVGPRAWYAGTPEPTRFQETNPGHVLVVDIESPGAIPEVDVVAVARTSWQSRAFCLDADDDTRQVAEFLAGVREPSLSLVQCTVSGALSLEAQTRLERLFDEAREAFLYVRSDTKGLVDRDGAEVTALRADPFLHRVMTALGESTSPDATRAMRLLYRLALEGGAS